MWLVTVINSAPSSPRVWDWSNLEGLIFDGTDRLKENCGLQEHSRTESGSGELCGV